MEPSCEPVEIALSIWWVLLSRIRVRIPAFIIMTSAASTRPPCRQGSSCCVTTAFRLPASSRRICACCFSGNTSMMRFTVSAAERVCSVANTRCPVSAARIALEIVSVSRISPMRITSGSSRSTARIPSEKLSVSMPISRWLTSARSTEV